MAKTANLNIRIDPETKSRAEVLFNNFGLTVSEAVNVFLHQSLLYGGIPFELKMPNKETMDVLEEVVERKNLVGPFNSVSALIEDLDS